MAAARGREMEGVSRVVKAGVRAKVELVGMREAAMAVVAKGEG